MKRIFSIVLLFALLTNVFSQSVEDLAKLGGDKMANGLHSEALEYYKQAIALITDETSHSTTYAYAGMCASEMGDVATAKAYFISSIERGIEEPRIFDMLGELGRKEKDYATQILAYQAGVERSPSDKEKYQLKLCYVYKKQKDAEQLMAMSESVLSYQPENLKALEYKGTAFQYQKKMSDAEATFKQLYSLDNENVNANIFLGNYYYQVGKNKLASERKKYEKIAKPTRVQWHDQNEKDKATMNQYYVPAISHLETVNAQKPNSSIKKMLYAMYTKMGNKEKAALYVAE